MCSLYGNNLHLFSRIFKIVTSLLVWSTISLLYWKFSAILHFSWIIESYCDDFTMCLVNVKCLHAYCILDRGSLVVITMWFTDKKSVVDFNYCSCSHMSLIVPVLLTLLWKNAGGMLMSLCIVLSNLRWNCT
jgi:hypothetical protein